jgi:glycerol kinase
MNVLAIDQGTSSTKALVVADGGEVLGEGSAPVHPRASGQGAVEQDPQELLQSIIDAGRTAVAVAGAPVQAVGIANQGETVLRWDLASGEPLGPALSWQDRRAVTVTRDLAEHGERLTELSGLPLDPYFAAPKMAWLLREAGAEDSGGREVVVSTVDAWLNYRLAGAYVTDAATASRTLLLDLDTTTWSDEAGELFGLDVTAQPAIVDCDAAVGETSVFGQVLTITGLAVDQQAALFGESCFEAGQAKCTYGTGAFILETAGTQAVRSRSRLAACVAWRLGGTATYCLDGQAYSAGSALTWLAELELIAEAAELDRVAGQGDSEVLFVPALAGLGAPFWAPEARGGWLGLSLATGRDELVRAVIWGIAAQIASLARAMEDDAGSRLETLRVDGGLTRSALLMQAQADLLQAPVELYPSPDATALGVGALARLGAGGAATPQEAVGAWTPAAVFEPRMPVEQAEEYLARWQAAARALAELAGEGR